MVLRLVLVLSLGAAAGFAVSALESPAGACTPPPPDAWSLVRVNAPPEPPEPGAPDLAELPEEEWERARQLAEAAHTRRQAWRDDARRWSGVLRLERGRLAGEGIELTLEPAP